jgi:hypothetical protein
MRRDLGVEQGVDRQFAVGGLNVVDHLTGRRLRISDELFGVLLKVGLTPLCRARIRRFLRGGRVCLVGTGLLVAVIAAGDQHARKSEWQVSRNTCASCAASAGESRKVPSRFDVRVPMPQGSRARVTGCGRGPVVAQTRSAAPVLRCGGAARGSAGFVSGMRVRSPASPGVVFVGVASQAKGRGFEARRPLTRRSAARGAR